ncbi:universal stress protein [Streptomyces afghaniensis]|uniref:universal stress protein n=1 Tax=Streptomyces afghaniensis TaxID=66865 RepID=UPI002788ABBF|nr:universal stress protein [Streptomyces afghaniensis]MDQ1013955.1 nucleotide-binding universal stress UspA family protein [Streptomyces afghaniensis]
MRAVHLTGLPGDVLVDVARAAELVVLGSRGLGGIGGFMVGSVGQAVSAHRSAGGACPTM